VKVVVYDLLIPPDRASRENGAQPYSRESAGIRPLTDESNTRATPALLPRISRESDDVTSDNADSAGISWRRRDGGDEMCQKCWAPCSGHPMTDHEPIYPLQEYGGLGSMLRDEFEDFEVQQ
jgi:hypothetical protein